MMKTVVVKRMRLNNGASRNNRGNKIELGRYLIKNVKMSKSLIFLFGGRVKPLGSQYCPDWRMMCLPSQSPRLQAIRF